MLRAIFTAWILAAAAFAAQTVEGHVVNALTGAGIPGVTVFIIPEDGGKASTVLTDAQGRFRVDALKEGAYTAQYMDGVPLPRNFWPVPNHWDGTGQPTAFQIAGGPDPVHLEVKMQPIGKLSGRVLDAAGKPVPNAGLWLSSGGNACNGPSCFSFTAQARTNEKGEYSVTDLRVPGVWLVSAAAPSTSDPPELRQGERLGWAQTFYPGVTDSQAAAEVIVRPGGDIGNVDIKLAAVPVHRIRGVVLDSRGDPEPKVAVSLTKGFGPVVHQDAKSDGAFEFASVADGEWRLSAAAKKDSVELRAVESVLVKEDDLENVKLRLAAPFSIHGKIVTEVPDGVLAPKSPDVKIGLSDSQGGAYLTGDVDEKGNFTIENVYPGPYLIQTLADSAPAPYYLDSIRLGGREALDPEVPILNDAQPLTVTYKLGGGAVRGNLEACGRARIYLVPRDPALRRGDFIRMASCGPNGGFEFSSVRPGEYYGLAIAWSDPTPWYGGMLNDGLLRQAGVVSVRANEATSADIRLIAR